MHPAHCTRTQLARPATTVPRLRCRYLKWRYVYCTCRDFSANYFSTRTTILCTYRLELQYSVSYRPVQQRCRRPCYSSMYPDCLLLICTSAAFIYAYSHHCTATTAVHANDLSLSLPLSLSLSRALSLSLWCSIAKDLFSIHNIPSLS